MRTITRSTITLAAAAGLFGSVLVGAGFAQTTASGTIPLPALLDQIGFTADGRQEWDDGNVEVKGRLSDGTRVEVHYDGDGIREIEAQGRYATLPLGLVDSFVPDASERHPQLSHITRLTKIEVDDDGEVEVEGLSVDGHEIEAEFDRAGQMIQYERR